MPSSDKRPRNRNDSHRSRRHHSRSRSPRIHSTHTSSSTNHDKKRPDRSHEPNSDRKDRDRSHRDRDRDHHRRDRDRDRHDGRREHTRVDGDKPRDGGMVKSRGPLPSQESSWAVTTGAAPPVEVEKPNFGNTGVLAAESNSVKQADGTIIRLKYSEPADAAKPRGKEAGMWKLVVFRGKDVVDTVTLGSRSMWLFGREKAVVDFPVESGSVSGQHMVFQFRLKEGRNEFGDREAKVRLYVIDLESGNGTRLNGEKVPTSCYVEVRHKDVVRLGKSSTEYVVMFS